MPEFQGDLPSQHKQIHDGIPQQSVTRSIVKLFAGLDKYDGYIKEALDAPREYSPAKLRDAMDTFKDVLMQRRS
jgi:hypothetical protein